MAYQTTYATGFEAGVGSYYTTQGGWVHWNGGNSPGIDSTVANQHRTLGGVGGSYCMNLNYSAVKSPVISTTSRWVHFWSKVPSPDYPLVIQFALNNTRQMTVQFIQATGIVEIYRATTLIAASSAGAWNYQQPHWIAIRLTAASSGGVCAVFVDGVQVVTFSGDTAEQASDGWDQFTFGGGFFGGFVGAAFSLVDDLIVTDDDSGVMTTPLPEMYSIAVVPDGVVSGNLTGVPTTGASRYQNIDEGGASGPVSQAEYNLAAAINDEDLYSLATPVTPTTVYSAVVWAEVGRDGAITQSAIRTVSGASDTYGTATLLPASPAFASTYRIHTRNPDGDVAWTLGSLTALQVGIKFT